MKNYTLLIKLLGSAVIFLFLQYGCKKDDQTQVKTLSTQDQTLFKKGKKLENPYDLKYMKQAFKNVKNRSLLKSWIPISEDEIITTHLYVRFLPSTQEEVNTLIDNSSVELFPYPLDYELDENTAYVDPTLPENSPGWLYTAVPANYAFPSVSHEVLAECYIPDINAQNSEALNNFLSEMEIEAFVISGNSNLIPGTLKSTGSTLSAQNPTGTVRVWNTATNQFDGIKGVKVRTHNFIKISATSTTESGYFIQPMSYRTNVNYDMIFENADGFKIWGNRFMIAPAIYDMGWHSNSGYSKDILANTDEWLWAEINNAAYDYNRKCYQNQVAFPPSNIRLWSAQIGGTWLGSTPMARNITLSPENLGQFLAICWLGYQTYSISIIVSLCLPDIFILLKSNETNTRKIYETVFHECAHASHYSIAGKNYWLAYVGYIITHLGYGDGSAANAGYCGVGEMWGNFYGADCGRHQFGNLSSSFRYDEDWYKPGFLMELHDYAGLTESQLFFCLTPQVTSIPALRDKLIQLYPSKTTIINDKYAKYFN